MSRPPRDLDVATLVHYPARARQAIQRAVVRGAIPLGGVIADVERDDVPLPPEIAREVIVGAQNGFSFVVKPQLRPQLFPGSQLPGKFFQRFTRSSGFP